MIEFLFRNHTYPQEPQTSNYMKQMCVRHRSNDAIIWLMTLPVNSGHGHSLGMEDMCWEPANLTGAHCTLLPRIRTLIKTFFPSHPPIEKPTRGVLVFMDVGSPATSPIPFMTPRPPPQASRQTSYSILIWARTLNLVVNR